MFGGVFAFRVRGEVPRTLSARFLLLGAGAGFVGAIDARLAFLVAALHAVAAGLRDFADAVVCTGEAAANDAQEHQERDGGLHVLCVLSCFGYGLDSPDESPSLSYVRRLPVLFSRLNPPLTS